jgi:anti-sigma regulatory factor (Ser/Thr protein kinase)
MTDALRISLLATEAASGLVRTLARARIDKWGIAHISDDAFLVIAELIANAVAATPHQEIRFSLTRDAAGVVIAVWDSSPRLPVLKPVTEFTLDTLDLAEDHWDDNGGWGLALVTSLASDYGYTPDPSGGKWVWARLKALG